MPNCSTIIDKLSYNKRNHFDSFSAALQFSRVTGVMFYVNQKVYFMATNYKFDRLSASRDYIADNYSVSLSLSSIAKHSNMSPYHFLRVFKNMYGETPNEFLIRLRSAASQDSWFYRCTSPCRPRFFIKSVFISFI